MLSRYIWTISGYLDIIYYLQRVSVCHLPGSGGGHQARLWGAAEAGTPYTATPHLCCAQSVAGITTHNTQPTPHNTQHCTIKGLLPTG